MGSIPEEPAPLMYPPPLEEARGAPIEANGSTPDLETPILIVGGGPVGMLQALLFARIHKQKCMVIEREHDTTTYPKMEYTNGRSMEIYRQMGLADEFRARATKHLPEDATSDEMNVTSLSPGGYLIENWKRPRAVDHRKQSHEVNDGSKYLEPHLREHQIYVERWLKEWLQREELITGLWGHSFVGLVEDDAGVTSEVKTDNGTTIRIRSQYVIGCDGGGSWVRKSVGLESKRKFMDMMLAFVHISSNQLRKQLPFGDFWHCNITNGGIVVAQDEDDTFTIHMVVPPGVDVDKMSAQEVVNIACAGTLPPREIPIDKVYCRGIWKVEVAVADNFRSQQGRVFLAGDAAHQLSPVGGHGLNSGLADSYDLAWKLVASMHGWGGETLLRSYNAERRHIAFKNLATVQECVEKIVMPLFANPTINGELLNAPTAEGEIFRAELQKQYAAVSWFHDQNGNILGYQYVDSPIVQAKGETVDRPISKNGVYLPTTWPGSRAPHVWLEDGKMSTFDSFSGEGFTLVDFSAGKLSQPLVDGAEEVGVPLTVVSWDPEKEQNVREVYERDLVLVRPDGHVAWRSGLDAKEPLAKEMALDVLRTAAGLAATAVA